MRREDDQQLWDLLGRAPEPPPVSDFFARDVLRRIRQEPSRFEQLQSLFRLQWLAPAAAAAVVVIGTVIAFQHPFSRLTNPKDSADAVAQIDPQDFEVVADLDVLIASDEGNLWDDNQSL
jgi:hypothetical protein